MYPIWSTLCQVEKRFSILWGTCEKLIFKGKVIELVLFMWNYNFLMEKKSWKYATVPIYSSEEYKDGVLRRKDLKHYRK